MKKPPSTIYVIGAGGHGKVAVRAAQESGIEVAGVFDDDPAKTGTTLCGVPILGAIDSISQFTALPTLIAIGDNRRRLQLAEQLSLSWATVVHPAATVDESAQLGAGSLVLAGAVVQADSVVGEHAIVNNNATVEHDARVAAGAHVSSNACVAGGGQVGRGAMIGAGAVVLPRISVGDFAKVGAGAVVTRHLPDGITACGVPARAMQMTSSTTALRRTDLSPKPIYLSPPHMSPRERELLLDAFDSNWIAPLGPHVDAFEREFAQKVSASHAVALASGTAAMHLALRVAGVQPGDRVLTSTLTFVATANAIRYVGAEPVFIDSDNATWNMDPQLLDDELRAAASRGELPKAALVVDICGQAADWDPILKLCRKYEVTVIEDAAEALGATYRGRSAGTLADIGCFSFNGNKIITTSGGGMLVTERAEWAQQVRHLATQARDPAPHYEHSQVGHNYRLSNLLAAVGRGQLEVLNERVAQRRANFEFYQRALSNVPGVEFMPEAEFGRSTRWLTCLTLNPRFHSVSPAEICNALAVQKVEARPMWKPMHRQPVYAACSARTNGIADRIFRHGLCLPSGSNLSDADRCRVVDGFQSAVGRAIAA
jgi:pyridoxal phosphate-dependent aminotransferase EpsN